MKMARGLTLVFLTNSGKNQTKNINDRTVNFDRFTNNRRTSEKIIIGRKNYLGTHLNGKSFIISPPIVPF